VHAIALVSLIRVLVAAFACLQASPATSGEPPAAATAASPPVATPPSSRAAQERLAAEIDAALTATWQEQKLEPVAPADDARWLRRVSVDLRGTIPTGDEVVSFLADPSPTKRAAKVDAYLADHHFAENFCSLWTNVLFASAGKNEDRMGRRFHPWLVEQLDRGVSFQSITREIVAGRGASTEPGALSFTLAYWDSVETLSGMTARSFLGLQIQCAQCHDHPFDHWKRDDYNRFTGLFFDMRADNVVEDGRRDMPLFRVADRGADVYFVEQLHRFVSEAGRQRGGDAMSSSMQPPAMQSSGSESPSELESDVGAPMSAASPMAAAPQDATVVKELLAACERRPPGTSPLHDYESDPQKLADLFARLPTGAREVAQKYHERRELFGTPGYLDGTPYVAEEGKSKREALADWILRPDNPWYGRAVANRMWGHLFGKGLVEPVDDLTGSKDVVLPDLLASLGRQFVEHDGDLRLLVGAIVRTKAYALGNSRAADPAERDRAERWFAAHPIRSFTAEQMANALARATDTAFDDDTRTRNNRAAIKAHKHEMLALMPNFGKTGIDRADPFAASIPKELLLMNGALRVGEQRRRHMIEEFRDAKRSDAERLQTAFLAIVGRPPRADEAKPLVALVEAAKGGLLAGIDDLAWALLNSTEFHTNH
jgi:hypothetical protein